MTSLLNFLAVDDDPIALAVIECIIDTLGNHTIVTASTGAEGIDLLGRSAVLFDCIILDLNMPDQDGLAFLRGAAALGFRGNVIISSGEAEAILRSARLMGQMLGITVLGAIKKPLSAASLKAVLDQMRPEPAQPRRSTKITPVHSLRALELVPFYQAQHDADDHTICGLEALIRARAPDGQIHGPGKLFGLIHAHDELVATTLAIAKKVLDDMCAWRVEGVRCRTSINLDAKVVEDPMVGPALVAMVKERDLDPALICLELTETALPSDMTRLIEALTRLRMAGLHLSLDDYGTGGSNFELLRLGPFTELKIDGSVVRSATSEPIAHRFIESAVAMAEDLSIQVVAEGVETEAQLTIVRRCGIKVIQGFLFSVPVAFEEIRRPLTGQRRLRLSA